MWSGQSASPPGQSSPAVSPPNQSNAPRRPLSSAEVVLIVVMWIVWLGVTLMADFLGFMMFAFADSPGAGRAAQAMIVPAFVWFGFTFIAGVVLLFFRRWWTIVLAFVLAVSPPIVIFAGYNVIGTSGGSSAGGRGAPATPATSPAPVVTVPPGGFAPPPMKVREQPDFRKYLPVHATTRPTTTAATTQP